MNYLHGSDNAYFETAPTNVSPDGASVTSLTLPPLPLGARSPIWNDFFVETHWVQNPQLIFIQRSEFVRMARARAERTPAAAMPPELRRFYGQLGTCADALLGRSEAAA